LLIAKSRGLTTSRKWKFIVASEEKVGCDIVSSCFTRLFVQAMAEN
jgi:hypothetical protein